MIKAFRIGVDRVPSWAYKRVDLGELILREEDDDKYNFAAALINAGAGWELVAPGEWIIELADGGITFCSSDVYEALFGTRGRDIN